MSKRILAEVFGVNEGYRAADTEYGGDFLRLRLEVESSQFLCPQCGSREVSRKGRRHRELQTVPIGLIPVSLVTEVPKCHCRDCGHHFELSPFCPLSPAHPSTGGVRALPRPNDVPG